MGQYIHRIIQYSIVYSKNGGSYRAAGCYPSAFITVAATNGNISAWTLYILVL